MLCDLLFLLYFGMIIGVVIILDLVMWIIEEGKFFNFFFYKFSILFFLLICWGLLYIFDCFIYLF